MPELINETAANYAAEHTSRYCGSAAEAIAWTQANTAAPQMMSGLAEARLLEALVLASGARRVLEVGTFTGVGALAVAAALPDGGQVITLEVDEARAAAAQRHFDASPHGESIKLILGNALETIASLDGPFDLVYIDADKTGYPAYYEAVLPKLTDRGVIIADNLFRAGAVLDPQTANEDAIAMREFARQVQEDDRVHNVLLTIGDGVMLAWPSVG